MSEPGLSATDMKAWVEKTSQKWKQLLDAHPEALALPCDVAGVSAVAGLLQHIVAVELRYAERLKGIPETSYDQVSFGSTEEIYATHDRAMALLHEVLADHSYDWSVDLEFSTRTAGALTGTVGCVVRDAAGRLAAATSTGGVYGKLYGRVGDSPIPGAGVWADNHAAVSCTGTGEMFLRVAVAAQVAHRVAWAGESLPEAAAAALADMQSLGGEGGLIAVGAKGDPVLPFVSQGMKRAALMSDGSILAEAF